MDAPRETVGTAERGGWRQQKTPLAEEVVEPTRLEGKRVGSARATREHDGRIQLGTAKEAMQSRCETR